MGLGWPGVLSFYSMSQPFSTAQQPRDDVLAVFVHEFGVVLFFDFSMFRWALGLWSVPAEDYYHRDDWIRGYDLLL